MAKEAKWKQEFRSEITALDNLALFERFHEEWSQSDDYDGDFTDNQYWMRDTAAAEIKRRLELTGDPDLPSLRKLAYEAEANRARYDRQSITDTEGANDYWRGRRDEAGHWRDKMTELGTHIQEHGLFQVPEGSAAIIFLPDRKYKSVIPITPEDADEEQAPEHIIVAVGISEQLRTDSNFAQSALDAFDRRAAELLRTEIEEALEGFLCTVCGKNVVDAEAGIDTCDECLSKA